MHYSKLLRLLRIGSDLKRSELINQLAPDYTTAEVEEEIEYLLMAGWIVENSKGFTFSLKWRDQTDDQKRALIECTNRPELINPIDTGLVTGVLIRRSYKWTKLNWHTFNYSLLGQPGIEGEIPVTLVTGLFQGETWFKLAKVKKAIERAATEWYSTSEGTKAWIRAKQGLNLEQLVQHTDTSYHLRSILYTYGIQNLKVTRSLSSSSWQETSLLGTREPEPTVVSSSQTRTNIYVVVCLDDPYIVGAFTTLELAKKAVVHIEYPEEMIDGILDDFTEIYQIIALPLINDESQDQRKLFKNR